MYTIKTINASFTTALIVFAALAAFFIAVPAEAARGDRADRFSRVSIEERVCDRLAKIFERLPLQAKPSLPPFCETEPPPPQTGTLIVKKVIVNDDDGDATANDFSFSVNGGGLIEFEADGENHIAVNPGVHTITEAPDEDYDVSYENCTSVDVAAGETETCTITNNDKEPEPASATLTLVKVVVNDDGGAKAAADFQAMIDGANVPWGTAQTVAVGAHTASEAAMLGYSAGSWGGDCASDGTVTLAAGENKNCSITNDDMPGTLIVRKVVINNDGGTRAAADFEFQVNGGATTTFEGDGENSHEVAAGTYTVSELVEDGYATTYANCENVAIDNGETEICTVTNNDISPLNRILLSEVHYDTDGSHGSEPQNEWVELYNASDVAVNLEGWSLVDASGSSDAIPAGVTIAAHGFVVFTASSTLEDFWTIPEDVPVVDLGGSIGNGLGNDGDSLTLRSATDTLVDALSWGTNTTILSPAALDVVAGHSLAREPLAQDTDTATDWVDREIPTPGS